MFAQKCVDDSVNVGTVDLKCPLDAVRAEPPQQNLKVVSVVLDCSVRHIYVDGDRIDCSNGVIPCRLNV